MLRNNIFEEIGPEGNNHFIRTNPCLLATTGKMEASLGSEFCESLPLNVLFTNTVVVPRKSNYFCLGRIRESFTEEEKDI